MRLRFVALLAFASAALFTSAAAASGNVLGFAYVPPSIAPGMAVADTSTAGAIAALTLVQAHPDLPCELQVRQPTASREVRMPPQSLTTCVGGSASASPASSSP